MIVNGTKGPVRNRSCPHAYRNTESAFISSLAVRPFHVGNDAPAVSPWHEQSGAARRAGGDPSGSSSAGPPADQRSCNASGVADVSSKHRGERISRLRWRRSVKWLPMFLTAGGPESQRKIRFGQRLRHLGQIATGRHDPGLYCSRLTARRKTRSLGLLKTEGSPVATSSPTWREIISALPSGNAPASMSGHVITSSIRSRSALPSPWSLH